LGYGKQYGFDLENLDKEVYLLNSGFVLGRKKASF
jgi:hypothetical protein